jgi:hypothetical protein
MRGIVWFLFYAYTGSSAVSAPRPRHETITGLVVAYTMVPSCLNGNGYWEMVIRVHQSKAIRSEFRPSRLQSPLWNDSGLGFS